MFRPTTSLPLPEFIALAAVTTSIVALATDVMLPALQMIGADLMVADPNDPQLVISSLFLGFAAGQLIAGPLSDCYGRKPIILLGYAIFIAGCMLSIAAADLTTMLAGRIMQGFGAAGPRVVTISLIRDGYEGRAMARIMSIIMSVFIFVPAVAPALGLGVLMIADWRAIFWLMLILAVAGALWMAIRQPETVAPERRRVFSIGNMLLGYREAIGMRVVMGYSTATGLVFGAFLSYLSSAQQVFQQTFAVGNLFPVYFGVAALAFGTASIVNAMLVLRFGMRKLTGISLVAMSGLSIGFLIYLFNASPSPGIAAFLVWLLPTFFCVGIQFGNLNALAMQPLGHLAGLGAALVGSVATIISVPIGWYIASLYDGGIFPLVGGFAAMGISAILVMQWTERSFPFRIVS